MENGISVIIPTYNREKFIKEAIQSVVNQRSKYTLEIIISDDGSTDRTIQIAEEFGKKVRIIKKPANCTTQGPAGSRNRGIKAASHPYICFLDSDDIYLPGRFEKTFPVLENNTDLGYVFCRSLEFKSENNIRLFRLWTKPKILKNDIKNPVVSRNNIVHTNCFIFRREVFDKVGYFNETYLNGEDGDLWMRISEQYKGDFIDYYGAAYRTNHQSNQLTNNPEKEIEKCARVIFEEAKKRYYELNLNDQNRIYKLNHRLLPKEKKTKTRFNYAYHYKHLQIILKYPKGYLQQLLQNYFDKKESKTKNNWKPITEFTNL